MKYWLAIGVLTLHMPASARSIRQVDGVTVNVKDYGALGDGSHDDTDAIQAAVNAVDGIDGATVEVPPGTYMIRTAAWTGTQWILQGVGLHSHMTFRMFPRALLKAIPTKSSWYCILSMWNQLDVHVVGGALEGDWDPNQETSAEGGFGIDVRGSTDVFIEEVTARDFRGDGFYVADSFDVSKNVHLRGCVGEHNRRQGLSIVACSGALVEGSTFSDNGPWNGAGIDLEPDVKDRPVEDVQIVGCDLRGNLGGIFLVGQHAPVRRITVIGNAVTGNSSEGLLAIDVDGAVIEDNTFQGNGSSPPDPVNGANIHLLRSNRNLFRGNRVLDAGRNAIYLNASSDNSLTGNTVLGSGVAGGVFADLFMIASSRNLIAGNIWRPGAQAATFGIYLATSDCVSNQVVDNDLASFWPWRALVDGGTGTIVTGNALSLAPPTCPSAGPHL